MKLGVGMRHRAVERMPRIVQDGAFRAIVGLDGGAGSRFICLADDCKDHLRFEGGCAAHRGAGLSINYVST